MNKEWEEEFIKNIKYDKKRLTERISHDTIRYVPKTKELKIKEIRKCIVLTCIFVQDKKSFYFVFKIK